MYGGQIHIVVKLQVTSPTMDDFVKAEHIIQAKIHSVLPKKSIRQLKDFEQGSIQVGKVHGVEVTLV